MEIKIRHSFRNWWIFLARGIFFILISAYVFLSSLHAMIGIGFLLGMVIIVTGISELVRAFVKSEPDTRGWHNFVGVMNVLIGLVFLTHLTSSLVIIRTIVGFYFLFNAIYLFRFRQLTKNAWWLVMGGLVVLVVAIQFIANPLVGKSALLILLAVTFLITGVLNVLLGLRLKPTY